MSYVYNGRFSVNILVVGRTACGKTAFVSNSSEPDNTHSDKDYTDLNNIMCGENYGEKSKKESSYRYGRRLWSS